MSAKAGRHDDQYMLRFPPGLRERIKATAAENGRSMNSEIIQTLESIYAPIEDETRELFKQMVDIANTPTRRGELQDAIDAYTDHMRMPRGSVYFSDDNTIVTRVRWFEDEPGRPDILKKAPRRKDAKAE